MRNDRHAPLHAPEHAPEHAPAHPVAHPPPRRAFIRLAGAALLSGTAASRAADEYPSRPLRIIGPYAAGASTDLLARMVAAPLGRLLGQPVVVENKPGAGGSLAAETLVRAPADGYTMLLTAAAMVTMNQHIYRKLPYDPQRDLAPVTIAARMPIVIAVNAASPLRTVADLLRDARTRPGQVTYGSSGVGTSQHLAGALFASMGRIDLNHVPYKGGAPAMTDLIGNRIDLMFVQVPSALPQVKAGRIRVIAIGGVDRVAALPDVPTVAESGIPGYDAATWYGFMIARATPAPVADKLHEATVAALQESRAQLTQEGYELVAGTTRAMTDTIRAESDKWGAVIREAKIPTE